MNSYTLTSKQIKKRIFYSFVLVVFFLSILDLALYIIIDSRTTKNSFVEEKHSKIKHFELNKKEGRDIVFIGDSRTIFHISSKIFKDNNLDIYNFGISGNALVDYPAFVVKAIDQHPKMIVLNLALEDLYSSIEKPSNPLWEDIEFYKNLGNSQLLLKNIHQWLLSYHMVFNYSEALVLKSKLFYERFEVHNEIMHASSVNFTLEPMVYDCSSFITQRINSNKTIVKCSNGDGLLLGEILELPIKKEMNLVSINRDKLLILKKIISMIECSNIKVKVIFEPIFYNKYKTKDSLKEELNGIPFLNFSEYLLDKKNIIDAGHFNINGREIYSRFLITNLQRYFDE